MVTNNIDYESDRSLDNQEIPAIIEDTEYQESDENKEAVSDNNPLSTETLLNYNAERYTDIRELATAVNLQIDLTNEGSQIDYQNLETTIISVLSNKETIYANNLDVSAEQLAKEIIYAEKALVENFSKEIRQVNPNLEDSDRVDQAIISLRSAILEIIINGSFSGEKITSIIGNIKFQKVCEDEIRDESFDKEKIYAYYRFDGQSNTIYIYNKFLDLGKHAQSHIMMHETAHAIAESTSIWQPPEDYIALLSMAHDGSRENIAELTQRNPALAEILELVTKTDLNESDGLIWNNYIRSRLNELSNMPENEEKSQERVAVARELVAELISSYLESDGSSVSYLSSRMRFCDKKETITDYLMAKSGCTDRASLMQFYRDRGISIDGTESIEQLLLKMETLPEFRALFSINSQWAKILGSSFVDKGSNIGRKLITSQIAIFEPKSKGGGGSGTSSSQSSDGEDNAAGSPHNGKDIFDWFFSFVTGKKS